MLLHARRKLVFFLIVAISLSSGDLSLSQVRAGSPPPKLKPLVRIVDLNVGESVAVKLCDGSQATVKMLDLKERRDDIRNAIRRAVATVEVNGGTVSLVSSTYRLPTTIAGVRIDCP